MLGSSLLTAKPAGGGGSYTGPLDIVSGAVVAYGQRALSAAKRGSALYTIRRDSDDATHTYNSDATTGDAPAAAISSFIGGGNGFVATWTDQSGNGNDVAQATSANQPQWLSSFTGGSLPGLDFSVGGIRVLSGASPISLTSGGYSCFAVALMKDNLHGDELCGMNYENPGATGWFAWEMTVTPSITDYQYFVDIADGSGNRLGAFLQRLISSAVPLGSVVLYDAKLQGNADASGQEIRFNGVSQTITLVGTAPAIGAISGIFNVGSDDILANSSECFYGQIMELLIYDGLLSDADRLAIRQNIAAYYGITLS
jgi:Alpha-L-arabinofuranosidase B, catalytic